MRQRPLSRASRVCLFSVLTGLCATGAAFAAEPRSLPSAAHGALAARQQAPWALQLEVFINGDSTGFVAAFVQEPNGSLAIAPDQLRNVGLEPDPRALRADGLIEIARLPGVSFTYDEAGQSIHFTAAASARATQTIDAGAGRTRDRERVPVQRDLGALLNYTAFASAGDGGSGGFGAIDGVSGWLEGRVFGPFGLVTSSHIVRAWSDDARSSVRLDTAWSWSDPDTLVTYSAGDMISGGLGWTRPVRLGGLRIRRNFGLRPDLVTLPLLELSGSAAVPSTVEVYVNNVRRLSQQVSEGRFEVADVPVVTDAGVARVVVRDALGRETVSQTPFFVSSRLLAPGLWDFSAEAGFARRNFGSRSNDYGSDLFASGTVRRGMTRWLTLETHAEAGGGLVNGGGGAAFTLGALGAGSLAASASRYRGRTGYQLAGNLQLALGDWRLNARTQRSFDDYHDIASVSFDTAATGANLSVPPRSIDQLSLSGLLPFDRTRLTLSYTRVETIEDVRSRLLSASLHRPIFDGAHIYASAFKDFGPSDSHGIFVGLSMRFGGDMHGSIGLSSHSGETYATAELVRRLDDEIGSYGWRLRDTEGDRTRRLATASYRARFARLEGGVEQIGDNVRAIAQVDGSVVAMGGGLFLANRIDDAFAVVDAGAPNVEISYENRPIGRTGGGGKLLLPDLRSWQRNRIAIDPANLPLDAQVGGTRDLAVPADRAGVVVRFDVDTDAAAALVTLRDEAGNVLPVGSTGRLDDAGEAFVIGYDGQAYVTGLASRNRIFVTRPDGRRCVAEFSYQSETGRIVTISTVTCRPFEPQ